MQSIYEILGISPEASTREIKKAYSTQIKNCDIDKEAERFQTIRQAYEMALTIAEQESASEDNLPPSPIDDSEPIAEQEVQFETQTFGSTSLSIPAPFVPSTPSGAAAVLNELQQEFQNAPESSPRELLLHYASSEKLISLEEREKFEQMLLIWIFEPQIKIDWLDAATDLFSWGTSSQHLAACRPDLSWRVKQHFDLRHLIESWPELKFALADGDYWYHLNAEREAQGISTSSIPPSIIDRLAKLTSTLEHTFPSEARERYGDRLMYWMRQIPSDYAPAGNASPKDGESNSAAGLWILAMFFLFIIRSCIAVADKQPTYHPPTEPRFQTNSNLENNKSDDLCSFSDEQIISMLKGDRNLRAIVFSACGQRAVQLELATPAH